LLLLALAGSMACGGGSEPETSPDALAAGVPAVDSASDAPSGEPVLARGERVPTQAPAASLPLELVLADAEDARLPELREALDMGRAARAKELLDELAEDAGAPLPALENALLRARLDALEGRSLAWGRRIETARSLGPGDARVYATAAELHAAAGRLETAQREIERGLVTCGVTPELERARGVLLLYTSGQAEAGLAHLIIATERAPGLPFTGRAMGQGYLLVGNARLGEGDVATALDLARLAVERDPTEVDAQRLLADALAAGGQFGESIAVLERLVAAGEPLAAEAGRMCKSAAMAAILQGQREEALALFLRARGWGLGDDELGTGAHMLLDEARRLTDSGVEAYREREFAEAEGLFRRALVLDPERLQARNHLAVTLLRSGDAAGAADMWTTVVEEAYTLEIDLPEPAHLNLAATWTRLGRPESARTTLAEYLDRRPHGEWAGETRALLEKMAPGPEERAPVPDAKGQTPR
jgi:tetratricopeptide (TPR) repeat protein